MCAMIDKLAADLTPDARPMVEDSVFDDKPEADNQVPKTVRLTTGNVYALAALVQLPQDMYRILGDDVAAALLDENGALDAYKLLHAAHGEIEHLLVPLAREWEPLRRALNLHQ